MSDVILLLTGASGALGVPLRRALRERGRGFGAIHTLARTASPNVTIVAELGTPAGAEALRSLGPVDVIIHAAACTKFRASESELARANIEGTRQLLAWAESLPHAPRMIHLSTTCVAGCRTGEIAEAPLADDCGFVNSYERTKWQAEQLVLASPLRAEVVRLATVIGSAHDGAIARPNAFHTTLRWLHAGLLPLVPGDATTRIDLLPTEVVIDFLVRLLERTAEPGGIYHVSSGRSGVLLTDLLELGTQRFSLRTPAWRNRQIVAPVLAPRATFETFRTTVVKSRDFLFNQVLESVDSFLPELFFPKTFATARAEIAWGGSLPLPSSRDWIARVIDWTLDTNFGRHESRLAPAAHS